MRMWEIREGYQEGMYGKGKEAKHTSKHDSEDEVKEAYECGYEDGYADAMEEMEKSSYGGRDHGRMSKRYR